MISVECDYCFFLSACQCLTTSLPLRAYGMSKYDQISQCIYYLITDKGLATVCHLLPSVIKEIDMLLHLKISKILYENIFFEILLNFHD